uniref:KATNIP domain-containing protein n=1 Tax=Timema shepardi TaxID=629360 RepID=A0A7R9AQJ8_TIMSH|nr:unnamed protein product [Timema shepardi]
MDFFKVRYVFWCLGMLGMAILYALRGNLSIAIVAMVNHTAISQHNLSAEFTSSAREEPCDWVDEEMQDAEDGELNWDSTYQAFILSGFFYGYLVGQVPGGILTERFHGKLVFGLGILVTAILTIVSPFTLWVSGELFFVTRLLEGLAEVRLVLSTGWVCCQRRQSSLVWLTGEWGGRERNDAGIAIHDHEVGTTQRKKQILRNVFSPLREPLMSSFCQLGTFLGNILCKPLSGFLCSKDGAGEWALVFYVFGAVGVLWYLLWYCFVYDSPKEHPRITKEEQRYIETSLGNMEQKEKLPIPWKALATCPGLWACYLMYFGTGWNLYTLFLGLPTYLDVILRYKILNVSGNNSFCRHSEQPRGQICQEYLKVGCPSCDCDWTLAATAATDRKNTGHHCRCGSSRKPCSRHHRLMSQTKLKLRTHKDCDSSHSRREEEKVIIVCLIQNALISTTPYVGACVSSFILSASFDMMLSRGVISRLTGFKIINAIGGIGPACAMLGISLAGCDRTWITLLFAFNGICMGANYIAVSTNLIALAPNYAGITYGVTNAISNLSSILAPWAIGYITQNRTYLVLLMKRRTKRADCKNSEYNNTNSTSGDKRPSKVDFTVVTSVHPEKLINVRKNRPCSWKLSHGSSPDSDSHHSGNISPSGSVLSSLVPNMYLDDLSREDEVFIPQREGSARHGRRAGTIEGSRSAGNSPRKTMQSNTVHKPLDFGPTGKLASAGRRNKRDGYDLLEESWSSLSFFERKHKGRLNEISPSPESVEDIVPVIQVADISKNHPSQSKKEDVDFIIPELPSGQRLDINIRSTWGDRHYLGLNGIEVFSRTGEQVPVSKVWADPADINILPEYSKDPRLVGNLLDGVNRTHDDMHLWLAPFTPGSDHYVHIIFQHTVSVAMVRIWNYNKSRIHSFRGARDVEISLDDVVVFRGEIARACGGILGGTEAFGDDERPFTTAGVSNAVCSSTEVLNDSNRLLTGQKLEISLMANWGHPSVIGLAGLEILGDGGKVILVKPHYLQCSSRSPDIYRLLDGDNVTTDENHMWNAPFASGDIVVLTITFPVVVHFSGVRLWNYNSSSELSYCGVKHMKLHLDDELVSPGPDGMVTVRRAPGNCHFNFGQDVMLANSPGAVEEHLLQVSPRGSGEGDEAFVDEEEYEPPNMPQGFVFQVLILSTWGDPYYVGLNGLELYDDDGDRIRLTENNIGAYPDSVNILEGVSDDVRTPEKLVDGVNDTLDGRHMWLAPILPSQILVDDLLVYNGVLDKVSITLNSSTTNLPSTKVPHRTVLFTRDKELLQQEHSNQVRHSSYGHDVHLLNNSQRVTSGGSYLSADQSLRPLTSLVPPTRSKRTDGFMPATDPCHRWIAGKPLPPPPWPDFHQREELAPPSVSTGLTCQDVTTKPRNRSYSKRALI